MYPLQQNDQCVRSSKGASSSLPPTAADTIGSFTRAIIVENSVGTGRRAAHCGVAILIHIVAILFLLILPLLSSETLHPYARTKDMIVFPLPPHSYPPRRPARSELPQPQSVNYPPNLAAPLSAAPRHDEPLARLEPPIDPVRMDPRGVIDGIGDILGGLVAGASTPLVLAAPRSDRQLLPVEAELREARLLTFALQYPELAQAARVFGKVILAAIIDTTGKVIRVHAVSGHPLLVQAAIDAVSREIPASFSRWQAHAVRFESGNNFSTTLKHK